MAALNIGIHAAAEGERRTPLACERVGQRRQALVVMVQIDKHARPIPDGPVRHQFSFS